MKNLKVLLFGLTLISSICLAVDKEEEERFLEKDGKIYKINASSLHLTPSEEDQGVSKASEELDSPNKLSQPNSNDLESDKETKCEYDMTISMGTFSPIGDASDNYDPGSSLSLTFPTKYNFNLFGKDINVSTEINLSNFVGISDDNDKNIKSVIAHFNTDFDLPVEVSIGLGLAHVDVDDKGGYGGTGTINVNYNLPIDKHNISIGFRYQKFVDVLTEDPYLDFNFIDAYSLNLNYSKTFSF